MPSSFPSAELGDTEAAVIRASLERMGLARPGETIVLRPLSGGVSSMIVRAESAMGTFCYKRALPRLKVASEWHAPVERGLAEMAWLREAARIIPGAVPKLAGEDREGLAFAMEFLDPSSHPVWKEQLRDGIIEPQTAEAVASHLSRLHSVTAKDPACAGRFANQGQFHALRLEPYFETAARAHPDLAPRFQALVPMVREARIALMHGDVSPKNILVGPEGPVFLDAECACHGDPAFDLAFCASHLLLKCVWRPQWRDRYLECLSALAGRYLEGVDWEPPSGLEGRTVPLLAAMLLARIDGRSPVEYIVAEADKQRVRGGARALLAEPPPTLAATVQCWKESISP
jgi:aminoglycoside phosphotransferase (APT) family kinase protein